MYLLACRFCMQSLVRPQQLPSCTVAQFLHRIYLFDPTDDLSAPNGTVIYALRHKRMCALTKSHARTHEHQISKQTERTECESERVGSGGRSKLNALCKMITMLVAQQFLWGCVYRTVEYFASVKLQYKSDGSQNVLRKNHCGDRQTDLSANEHI